MQTPRPTPQFNVFQSHFEVIKEISNTIIEIINVHKIIKYMEIQDTHENTVKAEIS